MGGWGRFGQEQAGWSGPVGECGKEMKRVMTMLPCVRRADDTSDVNPPGWQIFLDRLASKTRKFFSKENAQRSAHLLSSVFTHWGRFE